MYYPFYVVMGGLMGPIRNPVFSNWHHVMERWNRGIFLTKKLHRVYQLRDCEFRYRNVKLTG